VERLDDCKVGKSNWVGSQTGWAFGMVGWVTMVGQSESRNGSKVQEL
jgi:hypothetical protein